MVRRGRRFESVRGLREAAHRIAATDLGEVRRLAHQTGVTRGRPAPVLDDVTTAAMRLILSGKS
jgi:hypothetical protein